MPLTPDSFYLIPPNTPFASRLDCPVDHHLVHFLVEHAYQTTLPRIIRFPAEAALTKICRRLWDYPVASLEKKQVLLPQALCLCYYALAHVPAKHLKPIPTDLRIQAALAYLRSHQDSAPSNAIIAQVAHMHPTAFIRLFKQTIGSPPQAYSQMLRIEHACRLLHFTNTRIEEIASSVGFCDRYHFSRVFKKIQGLNPGAYRRRPHGNTPNLRPRRVKRTGAVAR